MADNPRTVIQPIRKISEEEKAGKRAPEEREYLICFLYTDETTSWIIGIGRTQAYDICRTTILAGDINVMGSIVLVEGGVYGKHATLYEFMKHMENFYPPEVTGVRFDIEDYVVGDSEGDYDSAYYNNTDFEVHAQLPVTNDNIGESEDI